MSRRVDKKPEGPPEESPVTTCPRQPEGGQVERGVEAAEGAPGGQGGGWWGSWISAAKDKSAEVLGMVKKDLDELSTAVKSEASHVINTTSSAIGKTLRLDEPESTANTMKKSFSTFIDQVNTVLNPSPDDEDTEVYIITDGEPVPLTTLQKEVLALQRLDATFLVPPGDEAGGRLQAWRGVQRAPSPAARQRMLEASPLLREKIHRLVPAALSEDDFWERYLFRKALLEDRLCNLNNPMSYQPSDAVVTSLLEQPGLQPPQQTVQPSQQPQQAQQPSQQRISVSPEDKGSGGGSDCPSDSVRSNCGSSPIMTDRDDCQWDNEDFAMDVELSEEQQIKLLEEYEEEIRSAKTNPPVKNLVKPSPTKSVSSPQLNQAKSPTKKPPTVGKIKEATPLKKAASKSSETVANVQKSITKKLTQKDVKKPLKKSDLQSKLVEDHFVDDTVKVQKASGVMSLSDELTANKIVDNASSNSDESWEKEFEFDDGNAPV